MPVDNLTLYFQRCEFLRRIGRGQQVEVAILDALKVVYAIPTNPVLAVDFGQVPFKNDFSEQGFRLKSNTPPLTGHHSFDFMPILRAGEDPVSSEEMFRRVKELGGGALGQTEAEKIIEQENKDPKIPESRRDQFIIFPGTIWEYVRSGEICIPYILFDEAKWVLELMCVKQCGNLAHVLVPRRSNGKS